MPTGVAIVAAFFAGMGALALARPAAVVGIFSISPDHADARNEVRAAYGGFGIAVAVVLVLAGRRDDPFGDGLVAAAAASLVGMAAGRIVGFAIERPATVFPTVTFLTVEAALAGLLTLSL